MTIHQFSAVLFFLMDPRPTQTSPPPLPSVTPPCHRHEPREVTHSQQEVLHFIVGPIELHCNRDSLVVATTGRRDRVSRSEEHTSELQSRQYLVCRLLLEKKTKTSPIQSSVIPTTK